eukprot:851424-Prymnesium_polylepis.1
MTKGFNELKARADLKTRAAATDPLDELPGSRIVGNVGVRDIRSLGEVTSEPIDESRSRVQPDVFMHS